MRVARLGFLAGLAPSLLSANGEAADHIHIGVVHSLGPAPVFIAAGKGYFAAEGLDAELVYFDSAQPIAIAGAAGDVDFGCTGMTAALITLSAQGSLRVIGAGTWEHPGFQSIGFLLSNQAYAAGLRSFTDLKDHSVAITQRGSPLDHALSHVLDKYHVPVTSIRFLPLQSNPNVASALIGGQSDAAVQTAANVYALVNKGQAHLLGWLGDELAAAQSEGTFATAKMANDHPDTVRRFLAAFRKASADWAAAFTDAAAIARTSRAPPRSSRSPPNMSGSRRAWCGLASITSILRPGSGFPTSRRPSIGISAKT